MNLDFDKIWASDTSPDYPSDTQTKRGLSYLGTEPPTFDLHDAIFQRLDKKDQWLYDQVRLTCERFGQNVSESVAGASRDTMANAITNALLTQRKADEGGYGISKMANADQTNAGQEYNFAVSPKHLAEYVSSHNTWENTKDKPQTATRWPEYSEVKNTPLLGSAAAHSASDFDASGSANEVNKSLVSLKNTLSSSATRLDSDNVERLGFDGNNRYQPYFYRKEDGAVTHLCPGDYVRMVGFHDGNQHLPFMRNISNDDVTWLVEGTEVNRIGIEGEYGHRPYVVRKADANWLYLATEAGVDEKLSSLNLGSTSQKDTEFFETKESADLFKRSLGSASKLSSDDVEMKDDAAAFKNSLKPGAFMDTSAAAVNDLLGSSKELANTKHIVELRERNKQTASTLTELDQSAVKKVRLLLTVDSTMYPGAMYGENPGEVIGRICLNGAVNGGASNSITVYALQYLVNGIWVTVDRGVF